MKGLVSLPDAVSFSSTCAIASTKQHVFVPQHANNLLSY